MPTYTYEVIRKDGKTGRRFEMTQRITDPPLKKDPKTGQPVVRVITAPAILDNRFDKVRKQFEKSDRLAADKKKNSAKNTRGK